MATQALPREELLQVKMTPQSSTRPRSARPWEVQIHSLHQPFQTPKISETQKLSSKFAATTLKIIIKIYFIFIDLTQYNSHCALFKGASYPDATEGVK